MALGELSVGKPPAPFDEGRALRGSFSLRDALRAVNAGVSEAVTRDRFESQLVRFAIYFPSDFWIGHDPARAISSRCEESLAAGHLTTYHDLVPRIEFQQVNKSFEGKLALHDLNLTVEDGEYLALVGPSGSGKTTTLRLLAGLEIPDHGRILVDGRDLARTPPDQRGVALVFQGHALFPHLTVRENLGLNLKLRRIPTSEAAARVKTVAESLGLASFLNRLPEQLSGGEKQRVALGRALVGRPQVLLLDEPLSDLDAPLRTTLRAELRHTARTQHLTVLHVTHDQREALALGNRVAVLQNGNLEQLGTPAEIYERPASRFVAGFIGEPPMNLWLASDGSWLGIRPEQLSRDHSDNSASTILAGEVVHTEFAGREHWIVLRHSAGQALCAWSHLVPLPRIGSRLELRAPQDKIHRFSGQNGLRIQTGLFLS